MDSVDSLDIVHGQPGQVQGVQVDWTKSTESMDWLDKVQSNLVKNKQIQVNFHPPPLKFVLRGIISSR